MPIRNQRVKIFNIWSNMSLPRAFVWYHFQELCLDSSFNISLSHHDVIGGNRDNQDISTVHNEQHKNRANRNIHDKTISATSKQPTNSTAASYVNLTILHVHIRSVQQYFFFLLAPKSILFSTVSGCDGGNRTRIIAVNTWGLKPLSYTSPSITCLPQDL